MDIEKREYLEIFLEEFYADVLYDYEERVINSFTHDRIAEEVNYILEDKDEDVNKLIEYAYGLKNMYMIFTSW